MTSFLRTMLIGATVLSPLSAVAMVEASPGARDTRVRSLPYDPNQVIRGTSTGMTPLHFVLEPGESPVLIAGRLVRVIGNKDDPGFIPPEAKDWLAKKSGNVLILQPLRMVEPSTMFMTTTSADGEERSYDFELRTREGTMVDGYDKAAYMTVHLAYKHKPTPEQITAWQARRDALVAVRTERVAQVRMAQAQAAMTLNVNYYKRDPIGCPILAPIPIASQPAISDDGHRTTLNFAPNAVLPEVYVINQDDKEALVTTIPETTATSLQIIVPSVQRNLVLRRGGKVCALRNNAFDAIGTQPGGGSGTVSPDVVRQVRSP